MTRMDPQLHHFFVMYFPTPSMIHHLLSFFLPSSVDSFRSFSDLLGHKHLRHLLSGIAAIGFHLRELWFGSTQPPFFPFFFFPGRNIRVPEPTSHFSPESAARPPACLVCSAQLTYPCLRS